MASERGNSGWLEGGADLCIVQRATFIKEYDKNRKQNKTRESVAKLRTKDDGH